MKFLVSAIWIKKGMGCFRMITKSSEWSKSNLDFWVSYFFLKNARPSPLNIKLSQSAAGGKNFGSVQGCENSYKNTWNVLKMISKSDLEF
jgi:hypothetical protein